MIVIFLAASVTLAAAVFYVVGVLITAAAIGTLMEGD